MSQARLRELADAVAATINADEWPLPFVATRSYRPHYVAAGDALEVCVRPFKRERVGPVGRVKSEWHYTIDIVVMRKCEFRDNDQVDPLLDRPTRRRPIRAGRSGTAAGAHIAAGARRQGGGHASGLRVGVRAR